MMLDGGVHRKIVASTLREIRGIIPLVNEGVLDEVRRHLIPIITTMYGQSLIEA